MKVKFYPSKDERLWYYRLTVVTYAEVVDSSWDPLAYHIIEGEHTGKHVLKSDCHQIITLGRLSA